MCVSCAAILSASLLCVNPMLDAGPGTAPYLALPPAEEERAVGMEVFLLEDVEEKEGWGRRGEGWWPLEVWLL